MVGVIAAVCEQARDRSSGADQGGGHRDIVGVSGAEQQDAGSSGFIGEAVELSGPPAARAAYGLLEVPPFAPAAER